ncbi:hypothetical protein [Bartonella sp. TP]|uniref:hypothetical protein n=1 Tax=Bartonella sp. TP TaxID=3057550 RepID=UPI0025B13058|nr:hypothetical protein [Bartonella sp. TP]WJW80478.1 hypothetical protein QVL57_02625 [Bartonella sp. TP]
MQLKALLSTVAIFACASSANAAHLTRHHITKPLAVRTKAVPVIKPATAPKTVIVRPYIKSEHGKTIMVRSYLRAEPGTKIAAVGADNAKN